MLADRSLANLSSKRYHPAADSDRCRDPQPNIRQSGSGNRGGRTVGARGVKDTTRRPTEHVVENI